MSFDPNHDKFRQQVLAKTLRNLTDGKYAMAYWVLANKYARKAARCRSESWYAHWSYLFCKTMALIQRCYCH
jgi:hypothetical protein